MLKDTSKYDRPHCPQCRTPHTFCGIVSLNYETNILTIGMSCNAKHEWNIEEKYEKMNKSGAMPPTTQSE